MADATVLFDSVPKTVSKLKKQGFTLGIVSTKFRYRIVSILQREHLSDTFDVIVGGEDVSRHKPDPEGLLKAMKAVQCSAADSVYIGDSVVDAEAAERAGVRFIAVLTGTTSKNAFNGFDVFQFADHIQNILKPAGPLLGSALTHADVIVGAIDSTNPL